MKYPNKVELLALIAGSNFRPFDAADWRTYCACETKNPIIYQNEEYTIVIDGSIINMVYHEDEYGGVLYSMHEGL